MLIEISNRQQALTFDAQRLQHAVEAVLSESQVSEGEVSVAVVDDTEIHALNRQFLAHDYPTDVLSFVLDRDGPRLEGELIVSADTALRTAAGFGWSPEDELLLYVIHGSLHLVGYDDTTPELAEVMRRGEARHLANFGLDHRV